MNLLRQRHADERSERPGPRQAVFQAPSLRRASWSGGDSPPALPEQTLELSPERTPDTGPLTAARSPAEFYSRILRTTCGPRNNKPPANPSIFQQNPTPETQVLRSTVSPGPRRSRPHPSPNRQVALSQFSPSQLHGPRNLALLPSFPPLSPCVLTQVLPPSVSTDRINDKLATPAAQMSTSCWTGFSPGSHRLPWYKSPDPRNAVLSKQRSFFLLVIYLPQIQAI